MAKKIHTKSEPLIYMIIRIQILILLVLAVFHSWRSRFLWIFRVIRVFRGFFQFFPSAFVPSASLFATLPLCNSYLTSTSFPVAVISPAFSRAM